VKAPQQWYDAWTDADGSETLRDEWETWTSQADLVDPAEIDVNTLRWSPPVSVLVNEVPEQIVRIVHVSPKQRRGKKLIKVVNFAGISTVLDTDVVQPVSVVDAISFLDDAALWWQIIRGERAERQHLDEVNQDLAVGSPVKILGPQGTAQESLRLWASHLTKPPESLLADLSERETGLWQHALTGRVVRPPRDVGRRLRVQIDGDEPVSVGWYSVRPA